MTTDISSAKLSSEKLSSAKLKEMDRATLLHPFTNYQQYAKTGGRVVTRAEHIYVTDSDNKQLQSGLQPTDYQQSDSRTVGTFTLLQQFL